MSVFENGKTYRIYVQGMTHPVTGELESILTDDVTGDVAISIKSKDISVTDKEESLNIFVKAIVAWSVLD
jgi:hypothetical protein